MTPDDVRRLLSKDPASTALLFDFDGTLAPIVDRPEDAAPTDGAVEMLEGLAARYGRVALISGREIGFLVDRVAAEIDLSGLYGLQSRIDGRLVEHPDAGRWRAIVSGVLDSVAAGALPPVGVFIESKGLSLTAHFRTAPEAGPAAGDWAADVAARTGLRVRAAKASVELHPPVSTTKGTAVTELAGDATTVAYAGDDLGDLPAFAALDVLAADGRATVKVASGGPELPTEVASAADLVVDGPRAIVELYEPLLPRASS